MRKIKLNRGNNIFSAGKENKNKISTDKSHLFIFVPLLIFMPG